jgi:Uncharacterized protein conserved in bacteria
MNNDIYNQISTYVTGLYNQHSQHELLYHNLAHTQNVVRHAGEIAASFDLSSDEMLSLHAAAWFHDVGHLYGGVDGHEERSIETMQPFLESLGCSSEVIEMTMKNIMATRMGHIPETATEEIIRDADTYHFGTKEFKETNKQIKEELRLRNNGVPIDNWKEKTLWLLERHEFHTDYCKNLLTEGKDKNVERMKRKLGEKEKPEPKADKKKAKDNAEVDPANKTKMITRGIQTMLRLTSENHLELSNMADGKANILISVNSIIISVILSVLLRKLESDRYLTIPTILFLAFSVATVVVAILATRPKISEGRFSKQDILNKKTNLLFFGNFHKSSLEEYKWGMEILMQDKDYLYGSLVQDIHHLGVVLGRKYRLIRMAYNIFMVGIIVSVIAFSLASTLHDPAQTTIITTPATPPL